MELTVHEFVEVLVRISFWRANPTFGLAKRKVVQLVPLPDCLDEMLRRVVLPTAKKDDTAAFRKELAASGEMLAALAEFEPKLRAWFGHHASSMMGAHMGARLQYKQWLDLLVQGYGAKPEVLGFTPGNEIGEWSLKQDSEITGDERCRNQFHVQFSMPMAKFAFINAQALDQLSVGQARDTDQMTTLSFSEFKECVARAGVEKYKPIEQMAPWVVRHAHAPLLSHSPPVHSPPCHPSPLHPPPRWRVCCYRACCYRLHAGDPRLLPQPARRGEHGGVRQRGDAYPRRAVRLDAALAATPQPAAARAPQVA